MGQISKGTVPKSEPEYGTRIVAIEEQFPHGRPGLDHPIPAKLPHPRWVRPFLQASSISLRTGVTEVLRRDIHRVEHLAVLCESVTARQVQHVRTASDAPASA